MAVSSMALSEYSDRELLRIVDELARVSDTAFASTADIAQRIGLDHERPTQCVGARLAWLRRYGVAQVHREGGAWTLTPTGASLIYGELKDDERDLLDHMESERLLMVTRAVARRYRRQGRSAGHLIRREWIHGTS